MEKSLLFSSKVIIALLILQVVPLMLFPASAFNLKSQEWWLPALLVILVIIAIIPLIVRRIDATWPWYLIGFSQGFNIISRLMMLMPHAMVNENNQQVFNTSYVVFTIISMLCSAFLLWFVEQPQTRMALLKD